MLDQPFYAEGNVATAGGYLAQQYLATWVLLRAGSRQDAESALEYVAPVGEKLDYVQRAVANVERYITESGKAVSPPAVSALR